MIDLRSDTLMLPSEEMLSAIQSASLGDEGRQDANGEIKLPLMIICISTEVKKLLGGNMRQSGIISAPGIIALKSNIKRLEEDHNAAKLICK